MRWFALCLIFAAGDAFGAFVDGKTLQGWCRESARMAAGRDSDRVSSARCRSYLVAIHDGYEAYLEWGVVSNHFYCKPETVTYGQLQRVVVKYLEAHREKLDRDAGSMVLNAYMGAFPCT